MTHHTRWRAIARARHTPRHIIRLIARMLPTNRERSQDAEYVRDWAERWRRATR
jgi:hypothetical protein